MKAQNDTCEAGTERKKKAQNDTCEGGGTMELLCNTVRRENRPGPHTDTRVGVGSG